MVMSALGPARPALDESNFQTARGAFELGKLYISRSRLRTPRLRVHAVLALISAAKDLGLATRTMESELNSDLNLLLAGRHNEVSGGVQLAVRTRLRTWLDQRGDCRAELAQELAASLSAPRKLAPLQYVQTMLAAGHVGQARRFAASWSEPVIRQRLEILSATALLGQGRHRKFVGQPFGDEFPPSLPRFLAMMRTSRQELPLTAHRWKIAERLLSQLSSVDRQEALAHMVTAAYHSGGYLAGARKAQAIRYQSCRRQAWLRLLVASLAAGRCDEAWRALEELGSGSFHDRGRLLLARHLVRRGNKRRALRLLASPFMMPLHRERALLLWEIEPPQTRKILSRWSTSVPRPSEDLAVFDPASPCLEHRWTSLAWRIALERNAPSDEGFSAFHNLRDALRGIRSLAYDRAATRHWLCEVKASGHPLASVLHAVRRIAPGAVEPIWSEHISVQAANLSREKGARPSRLHAEAFSRGLITPRGTAKSGLPRSSSSALATERCLEDEGISLSFQAARRRRAILGASKYCLKKWLVEGVEPQRGALDSRLRTLSNLGGSLATESLARVLESVPLPNDSYPQALALLTSLAPRRAAHLIFGHHLELSLQRPLWAHEILLGLEDHDVLETGFSRQWSRFIARVHQRFGTYRGGIWMRQLMAAWPEKGPTIPTLAALECCSAEVGKEWPADGGQVIVRCQQRIDALMGLPTPQLPTALQTDPTAIKRLHWLRPNAASRTGRPVSESAWNKDLRSLREKLGDIDVSTVLRFTRCLAPRRAGPLAQRLLAGSHPLVGASRNIDLPGQPGEPSYRLVYLDKRHDFFTFLRFADCAPCCFNSSSGYYRASSMGRWVLSLWKDPLSFCFHVESLKPKGQWCPSGFVFGSYSLCERGPAVLLNGIYLKHQATLLRASILSGIEETFCKPLGIRHIAIANRYGGYGQLPANYVQRPSTLVRLRALRLKSGPVTKIYDDISTEVNQIQYLSHLYWRHLSAPGSQAEYESRAHR